MEKGREGRKERVERVLGKIVVGEVTKKKEERKKGGGRGRKRKLEGKFTHHRDASHYSTQNN